MMGFLYYGNKFSKQNKLLKHSDNLCGHCDFYECEKMKKCQECNKRKVCKECYYKGETLCKECNDEYTKQMESLVIKSKVKCCEYCNNTELKTKKCYECGERTICSECFYDKETKLCKCCDKKLMKYYDTLEKEMNKKVINFDFKQLDEYDDDECERFVLL